MLFATLLGSSTAYLRFFQFFKKYIRRQRSDAVVVCFNPCMVAKGSEALKI